MRPTKWAAVTLPNAQTRDVLCTYDPTRCNVFASGNTNGAAATEGGASVDVVMYGGQLQPAAPLTASMIQSTAPPLAVAGELQYILLNDTRDSSYTLQVVLRYIPTPITS
jgi:hypothetical protein